MEAFVRHDMIAALDPPRSAIGTAAWLRQRLFASVFNTIITILSAAFILVLGWALLRFLIIDAVWIGSDREACLVETVGRPVGA